MYMHHMHPHLYSCMSTKEDHKLSVENIKQDSGRASLHLLFVDLKARLFTFPLTKHGCAQTYLKLPLRQWGAGNVYLLVLSS